MSPDPVSSVRPHDGYGLRAGWYDLTAWLHTRTRVLREPALCVAADPGLPFSAPRFAGFGWIILPSGLLAGLAMLAAVLVEMPESAFDLTIQALAETRVQVAPDEALRLAAGIDDPPDEARWQAARDQASAVHGQFIARSLRPGLALDGPQVDGAARAQAQAEIIALVDELAAPLEPLARHEFKRRVERRLLVTEKKLRFLKRWTESGASNVAGVLFLGLLMLLMGRSFRFFIRRLGGRYVNVERADQAFHYYVIARTFPFLVGTVAAVVVSQIGLWYQIPLALLGGMAAAMVFSILMVIGFFRSGPALAQALIGDRPERREARAVSWRLVWVYLVLQFSAALWGGLLTFLMGMYFRQFG